MNQTEQLMLASIRACAQTVDELVATVAALPVQLARQLEEVRLGVATALSEQAAATTRALGIADALRADMGELSAGLCARLDAAEQAHGETRQIIADNRTHAAEQAQDFARGLDSMRESLDMAVANVGETIDKVRTELTLEADKARITTEAAFEVATKRVESQAAELFNLNALVPKVKNELAEQIASVQSTVEGVETKLVERLENTEKALGEDVHGLGETLKRVEGANSDNFKAIEALNRRVDETATDMAKEIAGVRGVVTGHYDIYGEEIAKLSQYVKDGQDILNTRVQATTETLLERIGGVERLAGEIDTGLRKEIDSTREKASTHLSVAIDAVNKSVGDYFNNTTAQVEQVSQELTKSAAGVEQLGHRVEAIAEAASETRGVVETLVDTVATTNENLETVKKSVDGRLDAVLNIVDENDKSLTDRLEDHEKVVFGKVAAVAEQTGEALTKQVGGVRAEVAQSIATEVANLGNQLNKYRSDLDDLAEGSANSIADVRDAVKTVEAAVETKLRAVHEQIAEGDKQVIKLVDDAYGEQTKQIETLFGGAVDTAKAVELNLVAFMEGIDERFSEVVAKHGGLADENKELALAIGTLREAVNKDIESRIDKLLKAMDEVPVGISPEIMTEMQVRNAAIVDAQIGTALAGLRVETEYSDGKVTLVAVLPKHDGDEVRSVVDIPVEIGMRYREVWLENGEYRPGDVVTHKGSMWVAKTNTAGEPGSDVTGWTLAVKRGNHGRDGFSTKSYDTHKEGTLYREGDFLHWGNRLWQAKKEGRKAPDLSETNSTEAWALIGGLL